MRFGLIVTSVNPVADGAYLAALGRAAEARGFDTLWVGEHVVLFDEHETLSPYTPDGKFPFPPGMGFLETFSTLAYLAAATSRIRLGAGMCVVPQRNPVYTAKEIATIDFLSGGRVSLGAGIGWFREEFEVLGVPFEDRAARTREYLQVILRLWQDEVAAHDGDLYTLPPCRMDPKPVQQPHPPIFFGGTSEPALARVADLGQGWLGLNLTFEQTAGAVQRLEKMLADRGRSLSDVEIAACPFLQPFTPDDVARYAEAGVDQIVFFPMIMSAADIDPTLDGLCQEYMSRA